MSVSQIVAWESGCVSVSQFVGLGVWRVVASIVSSPESVRVFDLPRTILKIGHWNLIL